MRPFVFGTSKCDSNTQGKNLVKNNLRCIEGGDFGVQILDLIASDYWSPLIPIPSPGGRWSKPLRRRGLSNWNSRIIVEYQKQYNELGCSVTIPSRNNFYWETFRSLLDLPTKQMISDFLITAWKPCLWKAILHWGWNKTCNVRLTRHSWSVPKCVMRVVYWRWQLHGKHRLWTALKQIVRGTQGSTYTVHLEA